jgi:hypothetical protein
MSLIVYLMLGASILGSAVALEEGEDGNEGWGVVGRITFAALAGTLIGVPLFLLAIGDGFWTRWRRRSPSPWKQR